MKRILGILAAVAASTIGVVGLGADPASAAVPPAYFTCQATEPSYTIVYASYDVIDPQGRFVRARCVGAGGGLACSWYAFYWWNGEISGPHQKQC